MALALPEKIIQRQILGYLKPICQAVGKLKTVGIYDKKRRCFRSDPFLFVGCADIMGFKDNKIFFVEVKSKTGTQNDNQKSFQKLCQKAGITYILAHCLEDVLSVIK